MKKGIVERNACIKEMIIELQQYVDALIDIGDDAILDATREVIERAIEVMK